MTSFRSHHTPSIPELRAFVLCARLGSASRAAEALNLTQSAVSRAIRTLEDRLGVTLFHRIRQRMVLSDAGRAMLRDAEGIATLLGLPAGDGRQLGEEYRKVSRRARLVVDRVFYGEDPHNSTGPSFRR